MKRNFLFGIAVLSLAFFSGCRPRGAEYISDFDVVGTAYTKDIDFSARKTYAMWDTIVKVGSDLIDDPDSDNKPEYIPASSANVITGQIDQQMKALGWTKVGRDQNPDVYIQNAAMTSTYVYYYYSYWYYGYYYPYGGWYYPGYYPPTYSTTTTGSLLMMMIDGRESSPSGSRPVLWMGVINGLLEGSSSSFNSRVSKNVGQAFKQSPILKR